MKRFTEISTGHPSDLSDVSDLSDNTIPPAGGLF